MKYLEELTKTVSGQDTGETNQGEADNHNGGKRTETWHTREKNYKTTNYKMTNVSLIQINLSHMLLINFCSN